MKRTLIFLLLIFLLGGIITPLWAENGEPKITAQAAVLIDAETGMIIYDKNSQETRPPASITKIMTAILAIELNELTDIVEISSRAAQTGEASLNLLAGEKMTLENLLYGALLKSGNDACVAIAEHSALSVEDFVSLMNLKAQILGCYDTNFVNTNGLPAKNHYSTAYDLALIARYGLKNEVFNKIVATPNYIISWQDSSRKYNIKNTNRLLLNYLGASGVKTGTTNEAGNCLIASASRENRSLIAVILKSHNRFGDAEILLDYGFNNYRNLNLIQKNKIISYKDPNLPADLSMYTGKELTVSLNKHQQTNIRNNIVINKDKLHKKILKDEVIGKIEFFNNDLEIGSVPLLAVEDFFFGREHNSYASTIWQEIKGKMKIKRILNLTKGGTKPCLQQSMKQVYYPMA